LLPTRYSATESSLWWSGGLALPLLDSPFLWKVEAPKTEAGPPNTVLAVAFSPDGKLLAVAGTDAQIHLVNTADGKIARSLSGHTGSVTSLAFHPGGTLLVSASKDRTLRLWNPTNGQALKTLEGHTGWVQGVTFLNQGARLASVSIDQTVRLWDLK
jgi:WD40 repeat protein